MDYIKTRAHVYTHLRAHAHAAGKLSTYVNVIYNEIIQFVSPGGATNIEAPPLKREVESHTTPSHDSIFAAYIYFITNIFNLLNL